jgi:hypothetical protein
MFLLTKCLLFTLQGMQVAPPSFLQYVLQATELLYIQRLQPNQFVPCHQCHLLSCIHSSMSAKSSNSLSSPPWWTSILDNDGERVSSMPRILNLQEAAVPILSVLQTLLPTTFFIPTPIMWTKQQWCRSLLSTSVSPVKETTDYATLVIILHHPGMVQKAN